MTLCSSRYKKDLLVYVWRGDGQSGTLIILCQVVACYDTSLFDKSMAHVEHNVPIAVMIWRRA